MPRKIITYRPELRLLAREFRNNPTRSEAHLWERLKGKKVRGLDFHRQKPIGYYVVDFFCNDLMLAIEIDGGIHLDEGVAEKDAMRMDALRDLGISFLRFTSKVVMKETDNVIIEIEKWIDNWLEEKRKNNLKN
ncbi:MAG: endonuclease domain-containing protein [Bacteroidota bacterium]